MIKNPLLKLIVVFGLILLTLTVVDRWDNGARFFRSAMSFKSHYNSHKDEFAALAQQIDLAPPLGSNTLCLKASCKAAEKPGFPYRYPAQDLAAQRDIYAAAIAALDFRKMVFAYVDNNGEVISMPLGWLVDDYYVNATLHYMGDELTDLPPCEHRPTDGKFGSCAVSFDEGWFVKYEWGPNNAFDQKPGTAEAECDSAKRESFAAYSACLANSSAPQTELLCQDEGSHESTAKCIDEMVARIKRGT